MTEGEAEGGIEYRATIRFPRRDYEFMQKLIEGGEYTNITDIVRDAVKRFRLEWTDMEAASKFRRSVPLMPPMMGTKIMPRMKWMMRWMQEENQKSGERRVSKLGVREWFMDQMIRGMSKDEKKEMMRETMPKMMQRMFEGMSSEDKQDLMVEMMSTMMSQMFSGITLDDKRNLISGIMSKMMKQIFGEG
ncbi:MAG: hypothetical protein H3Z51_04150 [archaeon]|nr:hypothetical protein [archaeon]